jgi:integrase
MQLVSPVQLSSLCGFVIENMPVHLTEYKYMCQLMLDTGCRASESIELSRWSLFNQNTIKLQPQKRNDIRIFDASTLDPVNFFKISNQIEYAAYINYRRLEYAISGLIGQFGIVIKNKSSVCHLFRHNYVQRLLLQDKSDIEIKDLLGERTMKSTNDYILSEIYSKHGLHGI